MCAAARACETVRLRATTFASAWQRNWPAQADIAALQNAAKDMTALVRAAWPDVKTQPALVKEAHTALQQAMDAATQAEARAVAHVEATKAALLKVKRDAKAAAEAWEDVPPTKEERQVLEAAYSAARAMVEASPSPKDFNRSLGQATAAIREARDAADESAEFARREAERLREERAAIKLRGPEVTAALSKLKKHAAALAATWQSRAPFHGELMDLQRVINHTRDVIHTRFGY